MRKIVSNTSCLISLTNIDMLWVLQSLYGGIFVTKEVAAEYGEKLPQWIKVLTVSDVKAIKILNSYVDLGEASTIALAMETEDATMILDDMKARKLADSLRLKYTGTIGVLLKAKQSNTDISLAECIQKFRKCRFRISKTIEDAMLKADQ